MTKQSKPCLWCKKEMADDVRLSRRKFCRDRCRYAWHGAQKARIGDTAGVTSLAGQGELVQAIWTDLFAVFEKYGMTPTPRRQDGSRAAPK